MMKLFSSAALIAILASMAAPQAMAATTGLDFAGGCPEPVAGLCGGTGDSNADTTNVAAILGVSETLVTQVFSGFSASPADGTSTSGTWSVTDSSITHLAFKADGYFILAERTAISGDWMMDPDQALVPVNWDLSLAFCPASICGGIGRDYIEADFLNNGGQVADLSNVRAFSVVPVPAAVWLFGSGLLGLVGIARRKRS